MADMTDDDFILDELASAYLDDEVTADERAAIEADPRALARVAALRAVRVTLQADVGEVDDDRLEAALATALAAHRVAPGTASTATVGPEAGPSGDPSTGAPVEPPVDLAAARRRRAGRIWKPVLAVAGAAAIGVGAISGVANLAADGGGDDSASELAVPLAASDAASTDTNADLADDDAAGGAAPAASEAGTDPAQSGGDATRETISEIGVADVENSPALSTQPDEASAGDTTESTEATSTQAAVAAPALTTEQQLAAFSAETEPRTAAAPAPAAASSSPCPDLGYPAGAVVWQGTPGELYLSIPTDEDSPAVATVATVDCVVLVSVRIPVP
ncbi:MAG TPA: hypothetical protein VIT64_00020 [Ilumatobacteraceae bacterium]